MTDAWAIKDRDGRIILWAIGESERDAWCDFCVVSDYQSKMPQELQQQGYTCGTVIVSEKGEAEALLKNAESLAATGASATHIVELLRAYLSRGQG